VAAAGEGEERAEERELAGWAHSIEMLWACENVRLIRNVLQRVSA
jgi:hypothetical protein